MNIFTGIKDFDINRYMGKWYQIAAYPTYFYNNRHTNVTAEYKLEGNVVTVSNRGLYVCIEDNIKVCNPQSNITSYKGRILTAAIEGKALMVSPGIFAINFAGNNNFIPNYYIIYLTDGPTQYEISVVSDPTRNTLFILSRQHHISKDELNTILTYLHSSGFDLGKLLFTAHPIE